MTNNNSISSSSHRKHQPQPNRAKVLNDLMSEVSRIRYYEECLLAPERAVVMPLVGKIMLGTVLSATERANISAVANSLGKWIKLGKSYCRTSAIAVGLVPVDYSVNVSRDKNKQKLFTVSSKTLVTEEQLRELFRLGYGNTIGHCDSIAEAQAELSAVIDSAPVLIPTQAQKLVNTVLFYAVTKLVIKEAI